MIKIKTTKYYEEFLRYFNLAKIQQEQSNLGIIPHYNSDVNDDLMKHIELYDVVERKYAGFSAIINDCFYGWSKEHPYWNKMNANLYTNERYIIANKWNNKHNKFELHDWIYLFILHRVTGSAINYSKKPSGYHNTIIFDLHNCDNIKEICEVIKTYSKTFYTSIGYQFPAFPKPPKINFNINSFDEHVYKRGGDYFLCEFAPKLALELSIFLKTGNKKKLREIGEWMFIWNKNHNLRAYKFQYAAVIADIADWFPGFVDRESMFYYGTNAIECIGYLADPINSKSKKNEEFLDTVMNKIYEDTGSFPYNAEDVACDFIRWIENYIRPGDNYNNIDMDKIWNSSYIKDHPYGRQKFMLELGLVKTFNGMTSFPSDDKIIKSVNITVDQYKKMIKNNLNES